MQTSTYSDDGVLKGVCQQIPTQNFDMTMTLVTKER
jgi:hypothetical protein